MAVSKVVLGNETLIDLTGDSVSSENLLQGETAHGANGEEVIGGVVVTPMYTGTKAAIEEAIALGQIPEDAIVNITDDEETSSFQTQINEINSSLGVQYDNTTNLYYREYENGWVEMWGITTPSTNQGTKITFPFTMKDTSYFCQGNNASFDGLTCATPVVFYEATTTSVGVATYNANGYRISFKIEGFKA